MLKAQGAIEYLDAIGVQIEQENPEEEVTSDETADT